MKYKHKKTGAIAGKISENFYNTKEFAVIHAQLIEDSLDWEEVIDIDYEILSFVDITEDDYFKGKLLVKKENGLFQWKHTGLEGNCTAESLIGLESYKIHSVSRISDGEIFTLDDKIDGNIVTNRSIGKITLTYALFFEAENEDWSVNLKDAKHSKKSVLVTEDNVEKFKNDQCYKVVIGLHNNSYSLESFIVSDTPRVNYQGYNLTYFDSREKAEEYIENNKPQYSLNDIEKAVNIYFTITGEQIFENIKSHLKNG